MFIILAITLTPMPAGLSITNPNIAKLTVMAVQIENKIIEVLYRCLSDSISANSPS